jgi:adenylate kinase family enzyme
MTLICHIAGPSGSGKTTLLQKISKTYPPIVTKDLDEFDDIAFDMLRLNSIQKKYWSEDTFIQLKNARQQLVDNFLEQHTRDLVILGGFHTEDHHILQIPTLNKFLLNVSAEISAERAYTRSQEEKYEHRRKIENMESDILQAKKDIEFLVEEGYIHKTEEEILEFVAGSILK